MTTSGYPWEPPLAGTEAEHLVGARAGAPWDAVDWDSDPDWDFNSAADDTPEQLCALWDDTVDRSRARLDAALADGGLDQHVHLTWSDPLREAVDGLGRTLRPDGRQDRTGHACTADRRTSTPIWPSRPSAQLELVKQVLTATLQG